MFLTIHYRILFNVNINYTVLIEIIVVPSLHLNKNASLLMIRNYVFTGTVSASTPLSTQIMIFIRYNMKV